MATSWVALLRGINVGGVNRILMADLRARFEAAGFEDVRTYIQSGNVLFRTRAQDRAALTRAIESMLAEAFDYRATVTVRDLEEMRAVAREAPDTFGTEPDTYLSDVLFLMPPTSAEEVVSAMTVKDGVDRVWPGPGVVYSARLKARASQSGLSRIASKPVYQRMTIRSWSTTARLLAMLEEGS